jgi:hypothetical protein
MNTPLFSLCFSDATVQNLLGSAPMRLYPYGGVPADPALPYAVYREFSGLPENFLGSRSDIDLVTVQVEVYAKTGAAAKQALDAIRAVVEISAHVVALRGALLDQETLLINVGFDVDFWLHR